MANVGTGSPPDVAGGGLKGRAVTIFLFLAFLIFWEMSVSFGLVSPLFFPKPSEVAKTFFEMARSGQLATDLSATLCRFLGGFSAGSFLGLLTGLLMGWSNRFQKTIDPFVAAIHPMPKIALLPLVMVFFGIGEFSKIFLIALVVFFPMAINTATGVRQIHPVYLEVAKNYGASTLQTFKRVILPGSLPMIFAGIRLALNSAMVVTIAIELLAARKGLGASIWLAWQTLRMDELYAILLVTGLLGILFNQLLIFAERRWLGWQQ